LAGAKFISTNLQKQNYNRQGKYIPIQDDACSLIDLHKETSQFQTEIKYCTQIP